MPTFHEKQSEEHRPWTNKPWLKFIYDEDDWFIGPGGRHYRGKGERWKGYEITVFWRGKLRTFWWGTTTLIEEIEGDQVVSEYFPHVGDRKKYTHQEARQINRDFDELCPILWEAGKEIIR